MSNYDLVVQEDSAGCGVACVASLLGVSYREAFALFNNKTIGSNGVYCQDIVRVLKESGVKAEFKYAKPHLVDKLTHPGTIVYTAKNENYPLGHFLLRTANGWMNPWVNFPNIKDPKAGIVKTLPGRAQYAIFIEK